MPNLFSNTQIQQLLKIIDRQTIVFIGSYIGKEVLTSDDKDILKRHGIDVSKMPKEDYLDQAFKFGILSSALSDKRAKGLKYDDFKRFIKSGQFVPLNRRELAGIDAVKQQAASDVRFLGGKIKQNVNNWVLQEQRDAILKETLSGLEKRESIKRIVSNIGERTGQWGRDFDRIVEYVSHYSFEQGRAADIERNYGSDALLAKEVYPGACKWCIKLFLTNGIGSKPKLFKVNEIRANGTNIGKKPENWQPTLSSVHPSCRCTSYYIPDGYVWDEEQKRFRPPEKYQRKVERKSKVNIKIGNEEYEI